MPEKPKKLKKQELNKCFLDGLKDYVVWSSEDEDAAPLLVDIETSSGFSLRIRAYLFNLTNPPGGRKADEYKAQLILPGQKKGEKVSFDLSDGRYPILAAYTQEEEVGVFVLWDALKHNSIAFSSNVQVKSEAILKATYQKIVCSQRANKETIVSARPEYLIDAIRCRIDIMKSQILGEDNVIE